MAVNVGTIEAVLQLRDELSQKLDGINKKLEASQTTLGNFGKVLKTVFTTTAVVEAGKQVIDFSDKIVNLSEKTGMSTTGLQGLQLAFKASGVSIETVGQASAMLANKLVGGDKSAVNALNQLHLSVVNLKKMEPDKQFIAVADAIGQIQNPTERAFAAMQIFGRGGSELLAGMSGHLKTTVEQFQAMGLIIDEKTIKAIDAFGDQLGVVGTQLIVILANVLGPLLPALSGLANALAYVGKIAGAVLSPILNGVMMVLAGLWEGVALFVSELIDLGQRIPIVGKYLGGLTDASGWLKKSAADTATYVAKLAGVTVDVGENAKKATPKLLGLTDVNVEAEAAAKKLAEAMAELASVHDSFGQTIDTIDGKVVEGIRYYVARGVALETLKIIYGLTGEQIRAVSEQMKFEQTVVDATTKAFGEQRNMMYPLVERYSELHEMLTGVSDKTGDLMSRTFEASDDLLKMGVSVYDADGKLLHFANDEEYAAHMSEQLREGLHKVRTESQTMGEVLKTSLKGVLESIPSLIQQAFTGGGGLSGALQAVVSGIGASIGKAVGTGLGKAIGGAAGGPLGGAIGGAFGSLLGGFLMPTDNMHKFYEIERAAVMELWKMKDALEKQYGSWAAVNDIASSVGVHLDQFGFYIDTGTSGLAKLKKQMDEVQAALDVQKQAMAALDEAIKRYGFSIEELGPAMERQRLTEQAQQLYQDFTLLTAAGVDTGVVISHMSDAINEFAHFAMRTGAEVPAAMQPMLDKMISMGLLTDQAGNVITDLKTSGITFAETMTQGFDRVVAAVERLADAIQGKLYKAISNIPPIDVGIGGPMPGQTVGFGPGEFAPDSISGASPGGMGFAHGTHGDFVDFGHGTRVTLHGREAVVPEGESLGADNSDVLDAILSELQLLRTVLPTSIRDAMDRR